MALVNPHWLLKALLFTGLGMMAGVYFGDELTTATISVKRAAVNSVVSATALDTRAAVILEYPELLAAIRAKGTVAEGESHPAISQNIFSRDSAEAIKAVHEIASVEEIEEGMWFVRLGPSNSIVFETTEGMVLVDSGVGPAGPALVDALKSISDQPLHTVIYTHAHVDHAYGTWALLEAGWDPQVIAHKNLPRRVQRYIRLGGSIAGYMSQPAQQLPQSEGEFVWPTKLFGDELVLEIGGETLVLRHHLGETDDQFYIWVPGRSALLAADYYQDRIPNVGNGKRVTRYVEEWAVALQEMADLNPEILLPSHGPAIRGPEVIRGNLLVLAEALDYINDYTIDALNSGLRKDQVFEGAHLPPHLAEHPRLQQGYVSIKDVSKMIIKRYTGWWDEIPSHWSPAPWEAQAAVIVELAGGVAPIDALARRVLDSDIALASHLADWAFFAAPDDPMAQQLVMDVYRQRILRPDSYTQESVAYLDFMAQVKQRQLAK